MAVISDIAGTTNDSFSINGKATIFQGKREPKTILGKNGDIYFQSNGDIFSKKRGVWEKVTETIMPIPSQGNHKLVYSNGQNYDFTDITYEKLNNNNIITTIPGNVVLPKTPDATASFNNSDEKILEIPNINWINDPEKSLNVVHRTGDEDIGGKKKFTNNFVYFNNNSNYILSEKINNTSSINLNARNIELELYDEGNNRVWAAIKTLPNIINWCLSHPSNNINATIIACQGWVNNPETSLNVVHRSGDETLTGIKTLTADPIIAKNYPNLFIKNTDVIKGNRANETKYSQIAYRDKNGEELGYVRHAYYTDNNINESRIELVAVDPDPNHIDDNRIDTFLTLKSTPTTRSATLNFTPDSTPSLISQHIPTIGWINDPEKSLNVVHRTGDEDIGGTKTFSNVAYGTTPNDNAKNNEIITAEWFNNNKLGFPDYTSGISLPNEGSVESDGWIHFKLTWHGSGAIINNITVCDVRSNSDGTNTEWNIYPVKSGDTYSIWGSGSVTFYPFL